MFKTKEDAVKHLKNSFEKANSNISKLNEDILRMEGMSGLKTRHFYNNILESENKINYLEIGTWRGSSFISALYKNYNAYGIGVDNFEIDMLDPDQNVTRINFHKNLEKFLLKQDNFIFFDKNWRDLSNIDFEKKSIDVYMYDGPHTEIDHCDAIVNISPYLSDISIIIIDDWDHEPVRKGTKKAKRKLKNFFNFDYELKLQYGDTVRTGSTRFEDPEHEKHPGWKEFWNGVYATVLVRKYI